MIFSSRTRRRPVAESPGILTHTAGSATAVRAAVYVSLVEVNGPAATGVGASSLASGYSKILPS